MLRNLLRPREVRSTFPALSQGEYAKQIAELFAFNGTRYGVPGVEQLEHAMGNTIVAAVTNFRASVFSEATFKFQRWDNGRPGELYGTPDLAVLEEPWPGAGTSHLLSAMEVDYTYAGNSYWIKDGRHLVRLCPEHVTIITEDVLSVEGVVVSQRLIGYGYQPNKREAMAIYLPDEVAHYRLVPDPDNPFRGTSWLRSVLSDVDADTKMTGYKQALLQNSAVPGMVLKAEPGVSQEQVTAAREALRARNTGWDKVGRTLILGSGFDPVTVGQNMQQLDMKALQSAGESRIAAAAGVSPVLAGFSEGLQGSSLNAGNYNAARRRFADGTARPMWRAACTALSTLVRVPTGSRLWIDTVDIAFLQEDEQDAATIRQTLSQTMRNLIDAGYDPDAVAKYADTGDVSVLTGKHSGLFSVQLQEPGATQPAAPQRTAYDPTEARTAPVAPAMHFHLPESTEVELRQDRVVDMLEQFGSALSAIEARTALADERMANMPAPVVHVNVPPQPAPNVTVNVPEQPVQLSLEMPTPVINVTMPASEDGPSRKTVKFNKDGDGRITGATVIEE